MGSDLQVNLTANVSWSTGEELVVKEGDSTRPHQCSAFMSCFVGAENKLRFPSPGAQARHKVCAGCGRLSHCPIHGICSIV